MVPGTTIQFQNTDNTQQSIDYLVTATTPLANSVQYSVTLEGTGVQGEPPVGSPCAMTAAVPVPKPTQYIEEVGGFSAQPSFANAVGLKEVGGVLVPGSESNTYGLRITFQPMSTSSEWDLIRGGDL